MTKKLYIFEKGLDEFFYFQYIYENGNNGNKFVAKSRKKISM